jgi:hypothetical protein
MTVFEIAHHVQAEALTVVFERSEDGAAAGSTPFSLDLRRRIHSLFDIVIGSWRQPTRQPGAKPLRAVTIVLDGAFSLERQKVARTGTTVEVSPLQLIINNLIRAAGSNDAEVRLVGLNTPLCIPASPSDAPARGYSNSLASRQTIGAITKLASVRTYTARHRTRMIMSP